MKRVDRFEIIVKENRTPHVLTPSMSNTTMTIEGVIDFFGLEEPDVEWYEIYEVYADGSRKLVRQRNKFKEQKNGQTNKNNGTENQGV